ncbi:acyl-CoA N-acyltransferase [Fistulina hepatica ATCC 64428]|uniref:Acyl-CoA N-acyltransferase n=1 Tax=Fistulina hepatica ATCC 64428 TaxID=1128425 RepID=A0A0D7A206_9AGAR|nr:acyl-CoA N-acyltransferase [Fistulina hepatica ATCC 64428]
MPCIVELSPGYQGESLDMLMKLFEEAQPMLMEIASPQLDLLTFAQNAFHFTTIRIASADEFRTVGFAYLTQTPTGAFDENLPIGELNLGLAIDPEYHGHRVGQHAVSALLQTAFDHYGCHRVQANIISDTPSSDAALSLFTRLNFAHEGTRRDTFYSVYSQQWKDVTTLGILRSEWTLKHAFGVPPSAYWEALFERHARERGQFLRLDNKRQEVKRSSSLETITAIRHGEPVFTIIEEECDTLADIFADTFSTEGASSPSLAPSETGSEEEVWDTPGGTQDGLDCWFAYLDSLPIRKTRNNVGPAPAATDAQTHEGDQKAKQQCVPGRQDCASEAGSDSRASVAPSTPMSTCCDWPPSSVSAFSEVSSEFSLLDDTGSEWSFELADYEPSVQSRTAVLET